MSFRLCFLIAAALLPAVIPLRADTIYTNFGDGDAWSAGSGVIVMHDDAAWSSVAIAFTPVASYALSDIELVATGLSGDGAGTTLGIFADSGGHPGGNALESFSLDGLAGTFGGNAEPLTLTSLLQPVLAANNTYWIGLNAPEGGMIVWNLNATLASGYAAADAAGNWSAVDGVQGAVALHGVPVPTPEPQPLYDPYPDANVDLDPDLFPLLPAPPPPPDPQIATSHQEDQAFFVPEPATWQFLVGGLAALASALRRQQLARLAHQKQ